MVKINTKTIHTIPKSKGTNYWDSITGLFFLEGGGEQPTFLINEKLMPIDPLDIIVDGNVQFLNACNNNLERCRRCAHTSLVVFRVLNIIL